MTYDFSFPSFMEGDKSLSADTEYRIGRLENGLTYYLRHNDEPRNQCEFRIVQKVGSFQEEEHQRGLAHFLEHMAFEGTAHFPGQTIISYLENNGIKYGHELNAYTSFDRTVYRIDGVPTDKGDALVDGCLQILADWSGDLLLEDKAIDKERGIIKSEYLTRNSCYSRMFNSICERITSHSHYSRRMPIGLMEVVENCPYDDLRAYYRKWYHPQNQGIVVIGDIDLDIMEAKIREKFQKFHSPENPAKVEEYFIDQNEKPIFASASDKECTNPHVFIDYKFPNPSYGNPDYSVFYYWDLIFEAIEKMLDVRLSDLSNQPNSPLLSHSCDIGTFYNSNNLKALSLTAEVKSGHEKEIYAILLRLLLDIRNNGFSDSELDLAKSTILKNAWNNSVESNHVQNITYANSAINSFRHDFPPITGGSYYTFVEKVLSGTSIADINAVVDSIVSDDASNLVAYSYGQDRDDAFRFTDEIFAEITSQVYSESVESIGQESLDFTLIHDLPAPGSIVSQERDDDFGANVLILSNGARVIYKQTDFMNDDIRYSVGAMGGQSLFFDSDWISARLLDDCIMSIGLADLSESSLNKFLKSKSLSYKYNMDVDYTRVSGHCKGKDLESLMQILHCIFTNPGHSEVDFNNFVEAQRNDIENSEIGPSGALLHMVFENYFRDKERFRPLRVEDLVHVSLQKMRQMHLRVFGDASRFTFYFVGNIEVDKFKALLEKYIASLPSNVDDDLNFDFDDGRDYIYCERKLEMVEPSSVCFKVFYNTTLEYNMRNFICILLLANILDCRTRMLIRENAQIAYHTQAESSVRFYWRKHGFMASFLGLNSFVKPEYGKVVCKALENVLDEALANGFTAEELEREVLHFEKSRKEALRNNSSWLRFLFCKYHDGFDALDNYNEMLRSITVKDLNEFFHQLLQSSVKQTYLLLPENVDQVSELPNSNN